MVSAPAIPTTMKAAVLHGIGDLRLDTVPVPSYGPDEVLIRVKACGLCTSDVHYLQHGRIGDFIVTGPMILGHEVAGEIVAIGSNVTNLVVGDRVAVEAGVVCGRCEWCKTNKYNLCPDIAFYATPPFDGAMAEYCVIRKDFAFRLPDHATYAQGATLAWSASGRCRERCVRGRARPINAPAARAPIPRTHPQRLPEEHDHGNG